MPKGSQNVPAFAPPHYFSKNKDKEFQLNLFRFIGYACLIGITFFLNRFGQIGSIFAFTFLIGLALTGTSGSLKALAISTLIVMGNPFLIDKTTAISALRFVLLFAAAGRIFFDVFQKNQRILFSPESVALLFFCLVSAILIPINNYFNAISLMKIFLFGIGAYSLLSSTYLVTKKVNDLVVFFIAIMSVIAIVTLATIPLGISHVHRGLARDIGGHVGISGIISHPQSMGSFASLSAIFLVNLILFGRYNHRWLLILLAITLAFITVLTKSRTAVFTLITSIGITIGIYLFLRSKIKTKFKKLSFKTLAIYLSFLFIGIFLFEVITQGRISTQVQDFILKGMASETELIHFEDVIMSREALYYNSLNNFRDSPITGINFGTSTDNYFQQNASLISAPTEKGMIILGVLEEVGLLGFIAFFIFIATIFRQQFKMYNLFGISILIGFLIQNMGEMVFFAMGGVGLYGWLILAVSIIIGHHHKSIPTSSLPSRPIHYHPQ